MDQEAMLRERGWVENSHAPGVWNRRGSTPRGTVDAYNGQHGADIASAATIGSVRFYPTAEQAQTSPLLAACAARGMCERDVIGHLFWESEKRLETAKRLAAFQPPPAIHISADAGAVLLLAKVKSAEAIGAAWKALARANEIRVRVMVFGDEQAKGEAYAAVMAAKAAIRALGVDPDAADEPGQVQP